MTEVDVLRLIREAMLVGFIAGYEFYVAEFLSREIRDRAGRGKKLLFSYPYMITQICLAAGVQVLPGIDKMLEAINTTDLGLIKYMANPFVLQARQAADVMASMFPQGG